MQARLPAESEGDDAAARLKSAFDAFYPSFESRTGWRMDGDYERIPKDIEAALRRCTRQGRPAVVHVDVDPVKHMWAPELKTFKDMHAEPEGK